MHAIHPILLSLISSVLLKLIQIFSIFMKTLIRSARSEDPYTLCLASSWQVFNQQWKAILHLSRLMISSEALASNPFNEFSFVVFFQYTYTFCVNDPPVRSFSSILLRKLLDYLFNSCEIYFLVHAQTAKHFPQRSVLIPVAVSITLSCVLKHASTSTMQPHV